MELESYANVEVPDSDVIRIKNYSTLNLNV